MTLKGQSKKAGLTKQDLDQSMASFFTILQSLGDIQEALDEAWGYGTSPDEPLPEMEKFARGIDADVKRMKRELSTKMEQWSRTKTSASKATIAHELLLVARELADKED